MTTLGKQKQKKDQEQILAAIAHLADQCQQAWQESKSLKLPQDYKKVTNIIINGMGGSALGGHLIQSLFFDKLKLPLRVVNSYTVPGSVDKNTLYVAVSYSGSTEEPVASIPEAKKCGAKIVVIAKGGALGQMIKQKKFPGYLINDKYNPGSVPRMGLGYLIFFQLGLFKKLGLINLSDEEVKDVLKTIRKWNDKLNDEAPFKKNIAKQLAKDLYNKIIYLVGADFLAGNLHIFSNQINENAKNLASYLMLSELNHHFLEGADKPESSKKLVKFLLIQSKEYYPANQKRLKITAGIFKKKGYGVLGYELKEKSKINQAFETLVLGSYISFYLSRLNGVDPRTNPWVDYIKNKMKV